MSTHEAAPAIIDINLLPREHRPAQVSVLALVFAGALALCLLATIPLAFRAEAARESAAAATRLAGDAQYELQAVEQELAIERALRTEIITASARTQELTEERAFLQAGSRTLSEDLFWLFGFGFLPAGARITSVTTIETGFQVEGAGTNPLDGIAYAEKLVSQGHFPAARMTSFTPGTGGGGRFTVEVSR